MTLVLLFLKNYWKQLVMTIVIAGASYFVYDYIYDKGAREANLECAERMQEYREGLESKIQEVIDLSKLNSAMEIERAKALKEDLGKLFALTKNKPLTIIKEGKCVPSEVFVDTYNAAINRINSNE